jgi:NADH:ubiquinone oxidoreductase subunit K
VPMAFIPLSWYLILGAALFCVGVYGMLASRHLIAMIMSVALMLNAVVLNLLAFARYVEPARITGKTFAIVIYATAVAETALGLALILSIWRSRRTVTLAEIDPRQAPSALVDEG